MKVNLRLGDMSANRDEALLRRVTPPIESGEPVSAMDLRDYRMGAQILRTLGLTKIRLLTQHPRKVVGLDGFGVEIVEQIEICRLPGARPPI
jgi:3,4-dihydroxy 2-butanone 4-phosphate synthase/GTP cyclohydrolase II